MPLSLFPNNIIAHYNLLEKVLNSFVYMEICRGMYGLPQAGILANKLLKTHLTHHGYFEVPHMPGLWKHISRSLWFNLCVNDFGVKYILVMILSNISLVPSEQKPMTLLKIRKATSTVASPLIGIMHSGTWILTCLSMSGSNLSDTHTQHWQN
jgi:hypothetical protein